jgi:hypothetical protein
MSIISINGKTFKGENISISNGNIVINGKKVDVEDQKEINIQIKGDIDKLSVDHCNRLTVEGNANNIQTQSGDVEISGDVSGNVSTMSGDVVSDKIGGNVSTMSGDIVSE